jgi:hypothetical protein
MAMVASGWEYRGVNDIIKGANEAILEVARLSE